MLALDLPPQRLLERRARSSLFRSGPPQASRQPTESTAVGSATLAISRLPGASVDESWSTVAVGGWGDLSLSVAEIAGMLAVVSDRVERALP